MVLVLVVDIEVAILVLLGIAAIVYTNDKAHSIRAVAGAVLGVSMLFLGLDTMQEAVAPLAQMEWFEAMLQWSRGAFLLGIVIGAALSFFVQSSLAIVVLTIAFQKAGLFSLAESIMVLYGANVGSSVLSYALSTSLTGQSKQIAMYQTVYNFAGAIILIPAFYLEILGDVSLIKALTEWITTDEGGQIATVNLLFNALPGIVLFLVLGPSARLLERFWPETLEEQASKPKYLHDRATQHADSALDLIELEQVRLIEFLSVAFDTQREEGSHAKLPAYREASKALGGTIKEAISDLSTRRKLTTESYERLNGLLTLQHCLEAASEVLGGLSEEFRTLRQSRHGARFVDSAIEGVDAIVLSLIDFAREGSEQDALLLASITSEDGNGIRAVRTAYLAEEGGLDAAQRMQFLAAANNCERLIWLFGTMARCLSARAGI